MFVPKGSNRIYVCIGLSDGLEPNRRQAVTWGIVDPDSFRHMMSLGNNELIK